MAIEIKDILNVLGIEADSELSLQDIEDKHSALFISRAQAHTDEEIVNRATGRRLGGLETEIKRGFRNLGIDFQPEETRGRRLEEIYTLGIEKLQQTIAQYKDQAENNEGLNSLKAELESKALRELELQEELNLANTKAEQALLEADERIKAFTLKTKISEAKARIPFSDSADEMKRVGLDTYFSRHYDVALDEAENLIVADKNGQPVKDKNTDSNLSFEEVYRQMAAHHKLLKLNNAPAAATPRQKISALKNTASIPVSQPGSKALANEQALKQKATA